MRNVLAPLLDSADGSGKRTSCPSTFSPIESYPATTLTNGDVTLTILLPDSIRGYYRGCRFEPSGLVASAAWRGHHFFGPWKVGPHDPLHHDDILGTAEEFDIEHPQGYREAQPGEPFLKVGVGILRRPVNVKYKFDQRYPVVDPGAWTYRQEPSNAAILFGHTLNNPETGWGYHYRKKLELLTDRPGFAIHRELTNTGTREINSLHYGHHFIGIDGQPIGAGWRLQLPFEIAGTTRTRLGGHVDIGSREARFNSGLEVGKSVGCEFVAATNSTNPLSNACNFQIMVADARGTAVQLNFHPAPEFVRLFAVSTVVCPEGFVRVQVRPGGKARWSSECVFLAQD